jgi:hypothetical protein
MYFVCQDRIVIQDKVLMTQAYRKKETADQVGDDRNRSCESHRLWDDKTKPLPVHSVEGFYLVPEALYEEVLKKFKEENT